MSAVRSSFLRAAVLGAFAAGAFLLVPGESSQAAQPKNKQKSPLGTRLALEPVNPSPGWTTRVTLLTDDASRARDNNQYRPGDKVVVGVRSEKPGYLYLFNIDAKGEITLLFPNPKQKDNAIAANVDLVTGGPGSGVTFRVTKDNNGIEYIKAVVTANPVAQIDNLVKMTTGTDPIVLKPNDYETAVRGIIFGGSRNAPKTGDLAKDIETWKRDSLTPGGVVPEYDQTNQKWAEHAVEIYTGDAIQPPGKQQRFALVIGIDKFKSPNIRPLTCAVKDAVGIARFLQSDGKFAVTLLKDNE